MIILNSQVDREHTGSTLKCTAHNGAETVEQLERARARVTLDVRYDGEGMMIEMISLVVVMI